MRVSQDVVAVLDRATCDGNALSLAGVGQLDRALYTATNKALEAAGGKWNRKAQAHLFEGEAADAIEPIILTGEIVSVLQELQQFDTPPDLALRVIAEARIEPCMKLLEPSAGLGNLAVVAMQAGAIVRTYEVDPRRAAHLIMRITKLPSAVGGGSTGSIGDFLAAPPEAIYDRVVMNPPFAKGQDIRHVMHAARFLRERGRLVAIMSGTATTRQGRLFDEFRTFLDLHRASVVDLPAGSFKASGTSVNACLVSFDALRSA